jgi:hypothetical protein
MGLPGGRVCFQTDPVRVGGLTDLLHCLVQNPPPNRCNKSYRVQRMDTYSFGRLGQLAVLGTDESVVLS